MLSLPAVQSFHENLDGLCLDLQKTLEESDHPAIDKRVELSIQALEHLIFAQHFSPVQEKTVLKFDSIQKVIPFTRDAYTYYERDVEITHARALVEQAEPELALSHPLIRKKYLAAMREGHFTNLREGERMLVIGAGALPVSGLVYCTRFGSNVTMVEPSKLVRTYAGEVIRHLDLTNEIHILAPEHASKHAKRADVIMLAGHIPNKRAVLEELAPILRRGTRILCRSALGLRSLFFEHVPATGLREYTKIGLLQSGKQGIESTIGLIR